MQGLLALVLNIKLFTKRILRFIGKILLALLNLYTKENMCTLQISPDAGEPGKKNLEKAIGSPLYL
jgi:hypothetical protein